jgi:hypothetical protein
LNSGAPSIEKNYPGESAQFQQESRNPGFFPKDVDIGEHPMNEDEVDRPVAENLVCNTDTIVFGKMSLGGHGRMFARIEPIIKFRQRPKLAEGRSSGSACERLLWRK